MPEKEIETFVRKVQGGPDQVHHLAPWPTEQDGEPGIRVMVVDMRAMRQGGGGGELRHLSYDDPPGVGVTEGEYRHMLSMGVLHSSNEEEFIEMLVSALARDNVLAHGCDVEVAIPAVMEFARKVYAEFSGA